MNRWVQPLGNGMPPPWDAFARFPTWMWRNRETLEFTSWLRAFNEERHGSTRPTGFYGLDLYSMFTSIHAVLSYLDRVDPAVARIARERYSCLTPWEADPQAYGRAAISGRYRVCERETVAMLQELLAQLKEKDKKIENLTFWLKELRQRQFGRKSESLTEENQRLLQFLVQGVAAMKPEPKPEPPPPAPEKKGHGRTRIPKELLRDIIVHDVPSAD